MKNNKKSKTKRSKIMVTGFLSFVLALFCLGAGAYIGFSTLNYNYLTLGTMNNTVMYLFACSGLFIALGVVSVSVGIKLISMSKSTNFVFYTKKSVILGSIAFYSVIVLVSIFAIIFGFISVITMGYKLAMFLLSGLSITLAVICVVFLLKEYKSFMNKIKKGEMVIQIEYPKRYVPAVNPQAGETFAKNTYLSTTPSLDDVSRELVRLDEMRNKGLINDTEYQQLKKHYIDRMSNKLF